MPSFLTLRVVDVSRGRVTRELYLDWTAISLRIGVLVEGGLYVVSIYRGHEGEIEADRYAAKVLHAWIDRLVSGGARDCGGVILGDAGRVVAKDELILGLRLDNDRLRPGQVVCDPARSGDLEESSLSVGTEYHVASELLWQFDRTLMKRPSPSPTVADSLERVSQQLIRMSRYRARALSIVQSLDADEMAEICGVRMPSRLKLRNTPASYRRAGALAVWRDDHYVFPIFQMCQKTGLVRPEILDALTALPLDISGWQQFLWFLRRNGLLGGARPAVLLHTDAMAVLRAARLRSSD